MRPPSRRNAGLALGAALCALFLSVSLVSLVWTPYPVTTLDVRAQLQPPSFEHWLGTDHLGRDVLSMLMDGARNSILIATAAVAVGIALGVPLGLTAAARGGWADDALMRLADFAFAFPALLTAVMLAAALGPSALNAVVAIGLFNVPVFARVARGSALVVLSQDYTVAARLAGKGHARIALDHVLPNILPVLIVQGTVQFAVGVLAEAALSYLGLSAQPPRASWGRMLGEAQTFMAIAPRLALLPGLAIALTVLGLNLLGDGLRDALDPQGRGTGMGYKG